MSPRPKTPTRRSRVQRTTVRRIPRSAQDADYTTRAQLDAHLARLNVQVPAISKLIDAAVGDSVAFSSLEGPVMALLATIDAADATAHELGHNGASEEDRAYAESAKASVELARLGLTLSITKCPVDYAA